MFLFLLKGKLKLTVIRCKAESVKQRYKEVPFTKKNVLLQDVVKVEKTQEVQTNVYTKCLANVRSHVNKYLQYINVNSVVATFGCGQLAH